MVTSTLSDPVAMATLVATCAVAGLVQGLTGFGFAMVASPLLLLVLPPVDVVFLNIILSIVLSILTFVRREFRQHVRFRELLTLCIAMLPGQAAGYWLLPHVSGNGLKLGVLCVIAASSLLLRLKSRRLEALLALPGMGVGAGFVSGLLTPTTGVNGPPIVLYMWRRHEDKDHIRSTMLAYFLVAMGLGLVLLLRTAAFNVDTGRAVAWGTPFACAGFQVGTRFFARVSHTQFRQHVLTILLLGTLVGIVSMMVN